MKQPYTLSCLHRCTNRNRLLLTLSTILFLLAGGMMHAQEKTGTPATKTVQLKKEELKAVEGYYQNPGNKDMTVQFTAGENSLTAKLLWNNNQLKLTPESALVFTNPDAGEGGPLRVSFKKDSTGMVTQMSIGNDNVWTRVKDYKPVVKTEMNHRPEQLKPFEGVYTLGSQESRFISFAEKDNKLILEQYWDGNTIRFMPESELNFFSKEAPMLPLEFSKDSNGKISGLVAGRRDHWTRLVTVHPAAADLKLLEGKYQSKDDPDNYLQVYAKNDQLVVKQVWDGKEIMVPALTASFFYNDAQSYSLLFRKDKDGNYTELTLLGIDQFTKVK